jgi:hypothetical protein
MTKRRPPPDKSTATFRLQPLKKCHSSWLVKVRNGTPLHELRSLIRIRCESITNWCEGAAISEAKLLLLLVIPLCKSSDEPLVAVIFMAGAIFGGGRTMLEGGAAASREGGVLESFGDPRE